MASERSDEHIFQFQSSFLKGRIFRANGFWANGMEPRKPLVRVGASKSLMEMNTERLEASGQTNDNDGDGWENDGRDLKRPGDINSLSGKQPTS